MHMYILAARDSVEGGVKCGDENKTISSEFHLLQIASNLSSLRHYPFSTNTRYRTVEIAGLEHRQSDHSVEQLCEVA
jgi:hypothetical protein